MPEWLVQTFAIIGSSAIVFGLIVGVVKLALAIRKKLDEIRILQRRVEMVEDWRGLFESSLAWRKSDIERLETERELLWEAVDDINKRLRDAEKKA